MAIHPTVFKRRLHDPDQRTRFWAAKTPAERLDACHRHRIMFGDGPAAIPFISLDDLIANKAATPRAKDKIDLEELRKIQSEKARERDGG